MPVWESDVSKYNLVVYCFRMGRDEVWRIAWSGAKRLAEANFGGERWRIVLDLIWSRGVDVRGRGC